MTALLLSARCLLAAVFLVAGVGKLLDLEGSQRALREFGLSKQLSRLAGPGLPVLELAVAGSLLVAPTARAGAILAVVLLACFIAGVARALSQGRAPDCHCFGQIYSEPAGPGTIVRNLVIAAPATLIVAAGSGPSIPAALNGLDGTQVALVVTSALAAALLVAGAQLWRDQRRLRAELARVVAARLPPGLPRGASAPDFSLTPVRGSAATFDELRSPRRPLVLIFVSTSCGPCLALLPILADWQQTLADAVSLPVIFTGPIGDIERLADAEGLSIALAQDSSEVFGLYALRATPSAVLIDTEGRIAAAPAEGKPAIEALIRNAALAWSPRVVLAGAAEGAQ